MLFVKQQPFTQILDGTARSLTSGFPQCSKTFAPQVSAGATKITPATQPTPARHKWASDDKLCYRFNHGECISRSCRFGHKCLIYQSAAHQPRPAPYCSQPGADTLPQPKLEKGEKRTAHVSHLNSTTLVTVFPRNSVYKGPTLASGAPPLDSMNPPS